MSSGKRRGGEASADGGDAAQTGSLFIKEYRVRGNHRLSRERKWRKPSIPTLGPGRGAGDVEQARSSLEKLIQSKGFQTICGADPRAEPCRRDGLSGNRGKRRGPTAGA